MAKIPSKAPRPRKARKQAPGGLKTPPSAGPIGVPEPSEYTERGPHSPKALKRRTQRAETPKDHSTATLKTPLPETLVSLSEAARMVGVSKSTIWRKHKTGKLSATMTDEGELRIDPSELERAFAEKKRAAKVASMAKGDEVAATRIADLEEMLAFAKEQLEKTEKDRDAWREQAESAQRLLTDARPRRSWLWWGSKKD